MRQFLRPASRSKRPVPGTGFCYWRDRLLVMALALALGAMLGAATALAAGIPVKAEASVDKGYGRLVLTFKDVDLLPQYSAKTANGVLVLEFTEPVALDIEKAVMSLGAYASAARRDPDGKAVRMALRAGVKVNTIDAGEKLFIDFLPPTWRGPSPSLPQDVIEALAKRAAEALKAMREAEARKAGVNTIAKLDFRVGRLPTFTRMSFGWNIPFDAVFSREGEAVKVSFNRVATVDLVELKTDPPPGLRGFDVGEYDGKLEFVFRVAPDADVRAFREGMVYTIDLTAGRSPANPLEAAVRGQMGQGPQGQDVVSAPGVQSADNAEAMPWEADKPAVPAQSGVSAPAPASQAAPAQAATAHAPAPVHAPSPAAAVSPPATAVAAPGAPAASAAPAAVAAPAPVAVATPVAPKLVPALGQMPAFQGEGSEKTGELIEARRPDMPVGPVRVDAKRIGNSVRISFPYREPTTSAAFKRGDTIWLVFDNGAELDIGAMVKELGPLARKIEMTGGGDVRILRVPLTEPMLATMGADGNTWIVSIGDTVLEPSRPITLERASRPDGQMVLKARMPGISTLRELTDPSVGDRILVITAGSPPHGLLKPQAFVDVQALPSAQGLALVPNADDVTASIVGPDVTIGRNVGLSVTRDAQHRAAVVPGSLQRTTQISLGKQVMERQNPAAFSELLRDMQRKIASAPDGERNGKRLEMARFYIANRFAQEAIGLLRVVEAADPALARDPSFLILAGAAQALANRSKVAERVLANQLLTESADAAFWRTLVMVDQGKWAEARTAAQRASDVAGSYPVDIQAKFNMAAARAGLELNDFSFASAKLAEIDPLAIDPMIEAEYSVLQGRLTDVAGRTEDALDLYARAVRSDNKEAAAEAEYRRIRQLIRDHKLKPGEAVDRLQSLAIAWRGDDLELKTLRTLGNLLVEEKRYREAFDASKAAMIAAPDNATARLFQDEMTTAFVNLFVDQGKADAMKPIEALALYYDYREMTPVGRKGDEVVRRLADRLVAVDLLQPAADVLQHQVDSRLRGAARAQIAADLAVVHLLDRKPEKAIAVLNKTRQAQLPATLERQRRLVEARALSDSKRGDLALEVLQPLSGGDVERLRSDILWAGEKWRESGEARESMLAMRWSDPAPLDEQERVDVLKAGISYSLANDALALDRLRGKYAIKMADSPQAKAFEVVTAPIAVQGTEFREVLRDLAGVDTMRSFLSEYRQQYGASNRPMPEAEPEKPKDPPKPQVKAPAKADPAVAEKPKKAEDKKVASAH